MTKKVCFKSVKDREESLSDKLFILDSDNVGVVLEAMSNFVTSNEEQAVFHVILPSRVFFPDGVVWTSLSSAADDEIKRLSLRVKGRSKFVWEYYEYVSGSLGLHKTSGHHY